MKQVKQVLRSRVDINQNRPKPRKLSQESEVVPGQTFTIRELLEKSIAQGTLPNSPEGFYLDAEFSEINDLYRRGLDLTDLEQHGAHMRALNEKLEAAIQKKKEMDAEAKKRAEREKIIKEHEDEKLKKSEDKEA